MIIKACEITNFLSYYGENRIDFGLTTVVLGQNNTGKSKLFDAFNWVLYRNAYHTEREEWLSTDEWKLGGIDLINRRALREASPGSTVAATVKLEVIDDEEQPYTIKRRLETSVTEDEQWSYCREEVFADHTRLTGETEVYEAAHADRIIGTVAPFNLRPYFLFQGESVSQLLKLSDKRAYGNAIKEMARIDVLNHAVAATKVLRDRMERNLKKTKAANKELREKEVHLDTEIEQLANRVGETESEMQERDTEYGELSQRESELHEVLSQSEEYRIRLDDLENQKRYLEEMQRRYSDHQAVAANEVVSWLAVPAQPLLRDFHDIFNTLKDAKVVPQPVQDFFLRNVLERDVCEVCGRPLDREARQHVEGLLRRIEGTKAVNAMSNLATLIDSDLASIASEEEAMRNWQQKEYDLLEDLQRQTRVVERAREELYQVAPSITDPDEQRKQFNLYKQELKQVQAQLKEVELRRRQAHANLERDRAAMEQKKAERRSLSVEQGYEKEAWQQETADRLHDVMLQVKEEYRKRIAKGIEKKANEYFNEMTEDNPAAVGKLSMDLNSGGVYMVDAEGIRVDNVNQATRVSMQLSFVAALLSEASESLEETYPFVADAPISSLGGDNKLAAVRAMARAFDQAVIILKDDVPSNDEVALENDPVRRFIRQGAADRAYLLRMSEGDTDTQYTIIEELTEQN